MTHNSGNGGNGNNKSNGMDPCTPLTMVSLRDYLDTRLDAAERAIVDAKVAMDYRLGLMNEFRASLNDMAKNALTRAEYQLHHERVIEDIRSLRESRAELAGKASTKSVLFAGAIATMGVLLSVISLVHELMQP
jgi:hypothetical protein